MTLVHEIAHYKTYKTYGRVKPHGTDWKNTFKELMLPFVSPAMLSRYILPHLAKYLLNAKASTDSDHKFSLGLKTRRFRIQIKIISLNYNSEANLNLKKEGLLLLEKKEPVYMFRH